MIKWPVLVFGVALSVLFVIYIWAGRSDLAAANELRPGVIGFIDASPVISERPYIGSSQAPITLVLVIDSESEASREHIMEVMSFVQDTFVTPGHAKLYIKHFIPEDDALAQGARFKYATMASCSISSGMNMEEFYRKTIINRSVSGLDPSIGLSGTFQACVKEVPRAVAEDAIESRLLRIEAPSVQVSVGGRNAAVVYGLDIGSLNDTIRNTQVVVGI